MRAMRWAPRLLSIEESIAVIVFVGFIVVFPACLHGYAIDLHDWKKCAELFFWVAALAYAIWSGINVRKRRREHIQGSSPHDNE